VTACWELVSATVYGFLSTIVCPEVPSKQLSEHVGGTTALINEKVLITAIKVMTSSFVLMTLFFLRIET
jgi:hypothetical protein